MRIVVEKQDLSKALTLLSKVADKVAKNHPRGWFKLTTQGDGLWVEATNETMHLMVRVQADVRDEGAVCVSADDLLLAVKSDKNKRGIVELSVEGDKLAVLSGSVIQKLGIKPLTIFYSYPNCEYRFSIPADAMVEAINKVAFAVGKDEKFRSNILNNLFIHGKGEYINFVGSDGYILAVYRVYIPLSEKVYIYNEAVEILQKILKEAEGEIRIGDVRDGVDGRVGFVCLSGDNFSLAVCVFAEYDYPDYEKILSLGDNWTTMVEVYSKDLEKALNNVKKFDFVVFELTEGKQEFKVFGTYEGNETEAWVKGRVVGKDLKIGFKPKQLLEYLKSVDGYIHINLLGENEPATFRIINNDNYAYVVMPVLLRNS
jgi:DNA polymerase III sliding clamp (beta) subunit (PCNA family)